MLIIETFFLGISTGVAALFKGDDVIALGLSSVITLVFGFIFYWIGAKANDRDSGKREGLITVSLTWIVFSLFGMLPYLISGYIPSVTDAYFETMSGFTTTGATILTEIEPLPKGLLFWRSLTQWLGGMGMIV
ncbi:MAG: potassium transporter TrkG, partial [Tannerellaceae bacterium]